MVNCQAEQLHWLSYFALNGQRVDDEFRESLAHLDEEELSALVSVAELHHILIRTFEPVGNFGVGFEQQMAARRAQNAETVTTVAKVCDALEEHGCPVMAIKSSDHWPDLGNDFDLFTTGDERAVQQLMRAEFDAAIQPQTWGDQLANKWNFRVPGLRPLVEIHIKRLGQTGEFAAYGKELIARRRRKALGHATLLVPAAEDQIVLATMQRLYRHFFYRICDFIDTVPLLNDLDYEQLHRIARQQGIWQGVATHLRLINEFTAHYRNTSPALPALVRRAARFGIERLYPHASYFRLPLFPQGATLWGAQVVKTWKRRNHAAVLRLALLPPLAAAAGATYKISGRQAIW
jgi:Uncharacterised nucleotidyltransferase